MTTFKGTVLAILAGASLGACTVTNSAGEPVMLTSQNAFAIILAEMQKGCPSLIAAGNAAAAIATAVNAAQSTQGVINTASNIASISCSLLVPPPVMPVK